jgi:CHAT domain
MPRIDPELITFIHGVADFKTVWDSAVERLTPYFAINRGTTIDPRWYLLTARDVARLLALWKGRQAAAQIGDAAGITIGEVIKFGKRLTVNTSGGESVQFDKRGKPKGIDAVDPFSGFLAVHRIDAPGAGAPVIPERRRGAAAATKPAKPAKAPGSVTRIPHMDLEPDAGAIAEGVTITVTVFANTALRTEDEYSEPMTLDAVAGPVNLEVRLETSPHLKVVGKVVQPLTVDPATDSTDDLTFKVKALRRTTAGEEARITAYFSRKKRPCGLVRRTFDIPAQAQATRQKKRMAGSETPRPPVTGRLDARIDLDSDVLVVVRNPSGDLKTFQVEVHTNLLKPDDYTPGPIEWTFSDITSEIVYGMFSQFEAEGKSAVERLSSLIGAGNDLWDKAPANFVDLYWKLIDRKKPVKSIAIVSEDPYVPWELMAPYRHVNSLPDFRPLPLGVEFTIARWTTNDMITAPQTIPLAASRVVVPRYTRDPLKHAEEEVAVVLARVAGQRIDPADFDGLNAKIGEAKASLLHFACHGVGNLTDSSGKRLLGVQAVKLEGKDQTLDSRQVRGLAAFRAFFRQRPLVFLNACEVGQPAPALNGIGGLANAFINLGAAAVIAPLWSVDDEVAFKVATAVYKELSAKPAPTFAEVLRSIRTKAYVGDENGTDSYGAYCFYGDPLARPG